MFGKWRGESAGEHRVGIDVGRAPGHGNGLTVGRTYLLHPVVAERPQDRDVLILIHGRREYEIIGGQGRAVVPTGVPLDSPGGFHLSVWEQLPEAVLEARNSLGKEGLKLGFGAKL